MGFATPTSDYFGTTVIVSSNVRTSDTTTSLWLEPPSPYVFVYEREEPKKENIFDGVEPFWRRRWRLSLEAIDRYRRAARKVRLRVANQWFRVRYVARVCAQSERWRVSV